ncbi:MAG: hypothetical protein WBA13_17505 [Microcoleaceae cyanobacterium]
MKFTDYGEVKSKVYISNINYSQAKINIEIIDPAVDIPPESMTHIYQSSEQVKDGKRREEETGLGLTILR